MRSNAVQYFRYGPLEFNVNRAAILAANRKKYHPQLRRPDPEWIGPGIDIDPRHVGRADGTRPVIFVTFPLPGHPPALLIDGNHRVARALNQGKDVRAVVLDLEDTLRIVSGPEHVIGQLREEGRRLGLIAAGTA
jgi:hypothetical protein